MLQTCGLGRVSSDTSKNFRFEVQTCSWKTVIGASCRPVPHSYRCHVILTEPRGSANQIITVPNLHLNYVEAFSYKAPAFFTTKFCPRWWMLWQSNIFKFVCFLLVFSCICRIKVGSEEEEEEERVLLSKNYVIQRVVRDCVRDRVKIGLAGDCAGAGHGSGHDSGCLETVRVHEFFLERKR